MKTNHFKKISGVMTILLCASFELHAQRFGGFGGFGGSSGSRNNNNTSSSLAGSYNNNGSVGSATITVDPETHNIVVVADEITSQQISNVLRNLDAPKPQVLIKVVFLEVQRNNGSDIGIEGSYTKGIGDNLTADAANVFGLAGANSIVTNFNGMGMGTPALSPSSTVGPNGFYQIIGSDFQATLRAIATAGKSQVLSRPSVLARDGQLAEIVVGQKVPLPTSVSYGEAGNNTIPIVNVTYTDVGIILEVTPFIGANNLVEMIIEPQISAVDQTQSQTIAPGVSAPYLDVRSANTVVVTPDAQPIVIGGLISNTKSSSESKIPLLGDIPLLGNLFKSSVKNNGKTELLMFLTPHIVRAPSQLALMSGNELNQTSMITNTVDERELDRFLEHLPMKSK
jgi:general secretion pathway protein D